MSFSQEKVRFFRHNGYLKIEDRLPIGDIEKLKEIISYNSNNEIPPIIKNSNGQVSRLDNLLNRSSLFLEVLKTKTILDPLKALLGPNIEVTTNRHNHATYNFKGDNPSRLHRDVLQWSRTVLTAIIYLDETTENNGCTNLIPGSHFLPYVGTPNNGGTWMDEHSIYSDLIYQAIPIPMPAGGILIFDSLVFHAVGENKTEDSRLSCCFAFHSIDELSNIQDPKKILLVGEKLYRGNEFVNM